MTKTARKQSALSTYDPSLITLPRPENLGFDFQLQNHQFTRFQIPVLLSLPDAGDTQ